MPLVKSVKSVSFGTIGWWDGGVFVYCLLSRSLWEVWGCAAGFDAGLEKILPKSENKKIKKLFHSKYRQN